jgi:8-oxo-dGTP diphosphatase
MSEKKIMVLGFLFDPTLNIVTLIRKDHPEWQAGKLNGVGGHIKPDETPWQAMCREFLEETGVETARTDWHKFCSMNGEDFEVYCFAGKKDHIPVKQEDQTEEPDRYMLNEAFWDNETIENLKWLIPMAIDVMTDGRPSHVVVQYPPWPGLKTHES